MTEKTFDPSAPNQDRTIRIRFVTDENGDMDIDFSTEGFEDHPEMVAAYLMAAVKTLSMPVPRKE